MAIDSVTKRRSAACCKPFHKAPIPDGTIGAADRAHISWLYSGIAIGVVAVPAVREWRGGGMQLFPQPIVVKIEAVEPFIVTVRILKPERDILKLSVNVLKEEIEEWLLNVNVLYDIIQSWNLVLWVFGAQKELLKSYVYVLNQIYLDVMGTVDVLKQDRFAILEDLGMRYIQMEPKKVHILESKK